VRGQETVDRAAALVAAGGGVLSAQQAGAGGLPQDALEWATRRGHLRRLRRGFYTTAMYWETSDPIQRHRLMMTSAQRAVPEAVAVADSAAVVLGLPVPAVPDPPRLTLARRIGRSGGRGREGGTRGRRALLDDDEVIVYRGLRVTHPARTVVDCARHLSRPWALAVADVARRDWGLDRGALVGAAERNPRAPGHRAAVWAAHYARPEPESPLESLARATVILGGHPAPVPQIWVPTDRGLFRVDLMDEVGVVIEADGKVKYNGPEDVWKEKVRQDAIRRRGHEVVRFTMADHHRPDRWLTEYRRAVALLRTSTPHDTPYGDAVSSG
jgi:hypothetical protein